MVFLVLFAWSILGSSTYGQTIQIVTEDYPPYNYKENDQLTGFSTEIIKAVVQEVGIKAKFGLYPWPRAYNMALKMENTLIYTIARNQKRENLFKWVGPIASRTIFLYKLKERDDIQVNSLEDSKKYKIGCVRNDGFSLYMISKGFVIGKNLKQVHNEELNIKKLFHGRFDLVANVELYMAFKVKSLGLDFNKLEKVYELPDKSAYYMAFNIKTSDNIVRQFQEALNKIKQDGTYQRIAGKYLK